MFRPKYSKLAMRYRSFATLKKETPSARKVCTEGQVSSLESRGSGNSQPFCERPPHQCARALRNCRASRNASRFTVRALIGNCIRRHIDDFAVDHWRQSLIKSCQPDECILPDFDIRDFRRV